MQSLSMRRQGLLSAMNAVHCHPCDRSELGHQLSAIDKRISDANKIINFFKDL